MANYTAADVKKLRELTAAGMLDCKNALVEADGDFDKAVDIIRVKGLKGVTKREGRSASNGLVAAKVEGDLGVILELNCETDFVAKGDRFQALAEEILTHVVKSKLSNLEALLASDFGGGKTLAAHIDEGNATLGEKIEHCMAQIASGLIKQGVRRFVVAGGETSGAVVNSLGVQSLKIGATIDPGVPWTAGSVSAPLISAPESILLALKSGNFGSEDFFSKALTSVK